jgi:hypothetical protein
MAILLLLIDPPRAGLLEGGSNALLSLADWVERRAVDVEVRVLDWASTPPHAIPDAIATLLSESSAEQIVVGITAMSASYRSALHVAHAFKAANRDIVVCLGGHHATPEAEIILQHHPEIDLVFRGEGERSLLRLVEGLPLTAIPGISFRSKDFGLVVATEDPVPLGTEELDSIATDFDRLASDSGKFGRTTLVTARGCPLGCRFCVVSQTKVRSKSVDAVIADVSRLLARGHRSFTIEDNFFAQSPRRTLELCRALAELQKTSGSFVFDCQTRVESCSESIVAALAEAGCDRVFLGVEALTPRQLHFLGKTPLPERFMDRLTQNVLPTLFRSGIDVGMNLQAGIPGTNLQEKDETLFRLEEIAAIARRHAGSLHIFTHLHVIYSGTPEFRDCVASGTFPRDIFEDFTLWEAEQPSMLRWLGEHFAHGTGGVPIALLEPAKLRDSRFEVLYRRLEDVNQFLRRIQSIRGMELFDFAPELTKTEAS